ADAQNKVLDKMLGAVGLGGENSATKIVQVTKKLLTSFTQAFGDIAAPALNMLAMLQNTIPESVFVVNASPEVLARHYMSVPLMDGMGNIQGTMGVLSPIKLMYSAWRRIGQSAFSDPEFFALIDRFTSDGSL